MSQIPLDSLTPSYIKSFDAYIPSKPDAELKKIFGCNTLYRLNNNENPLGPPPAACEVLSRFPPPQAAIYPSGDSYYLRQKLSEVHGVKPDQILVGNGANEVITFVIKAFCEAGDNIITADKTFAVYEWVAIFSGYEARLLPLKDFTFDEDAMLTQIDARTKILFICNPNNPTGTYWNREKLCRFLDIIDGKKIVVVDEAYFEYVEKEDFPDAISLIDHYPNLISFRTFSKIYGLAGLRIGYLVGSEEVVNTIRRACVVYSVNTLAQEAAIVALDDKSHIEKTRKLINEGKNYLEEELRRLKLSYVMNEGNYVMIKLPISDTLAYRKLMNKGIMIRTMTGFRYPNYIRLSIGQHEAMEAFIRALGDIL